MIHRKTVTIKQDTELAQVSYFFNKLTYLDDYYTCHQSTLIHTGLIQHLNLESGKGSENFNETVPRIRRKITQAHQKDPAEVKWMFLTWSQASQVCN